VMSKLLARTLLLGVLSVGSGIQAFVWTPKLKIQSLKKYLNTHGAKIPGGVYLTTAVAISAEGSTIAGTWQDIHFNQGGWIAHLK
jgi:hypothetical protein